MSQVTGFAKHRYLKVTGIVFLIIGSLVFINLVTGSYMDIPVAAWTYRIMFLLLFPIHIIALLMCAGSCETHLSLQIVYHLILVLITSAIVATPAIPETKQNRLLLGGIIVISYFVFLFIGGILVFTFLAKAWK